MGSDADFADFVSYEEFRSGLPRGRFRVIVNPKLARGFLRHRLWLMPVMLAMIGAGLALALGGARWTGAALVFVAIAVNRLVAWNAGKLLLHLASNDPAVYLTATQGGVMEVRRA